VNIRRVIRKRIRRNEDGTQLAADVNAVVAANVNEPGSRSSITSRQRIVQKQDSRPKDEAPEGGDEGG
jgi:hypothetical protein